MIDLSSFHASASWPHIVAFYCATLLPLVAGLPPVIAIAESVHVMTGREIWRGIARFWGKLFGIALLMWAIGAMVLIVLYAVDPGRFGRYFQGIPGVAPILLLTPVVLAGGLYLWRLFSDWRNLGRLPHLLVTWLWMPLSALAVLKIALGYGLMDNPAGAFLDPASMRVRIGDVPSALLNPAAQAWFLHLIGSCYLTAATLVLSVSAWYLLRGRNVQIARRSMTVAAAFGLAAALSLAVLGDHEGYAGSPGQQMRIAAIAAEWHTQPAPASLAIVGLPDQGRRATRFALRIPWALGLGATHSWRKPVAGLDDLEAANASRIRRGLTEFMALDARDAFPQGDGPYAGSAAANPDLGYGLLTLRHVRAPTQRSGDATAAAARDTIPNVPLLFWAFRGMALLGACGILLFACAFWLASRRRFERRGFLRIAVWSLPLPWVAGALGWLVGEAGRGPWLVDGLLPVTATRATESETIVAAIACTAIAGLFATGAALVVRLVRRGPDGLRIWPADSNPAKKY
ncbi:cytochrome ubiquinol oxidase subunit I [Rhodanobacter aciditrophus]|uniref:cytochrome ubiquinol oxidase subunit I n=1 Tax=Rhodanobacter aciditrophus TaxID=1623218 RepID=UPI003CF06FAE